MLPDKEFEDLIRRKMEAHDEAPPTDGWKKIAADIRPPKKRRPIWWWLGPLALLLTGLGLYYFKNNTPATKPAENITVKRDESGKANIIETPTATLKIKPENENSSTLNKNAQTEPAKVARPSSQPELIAQANNLTAPLAEKASGKKLNGQTVKQNSGQATDVINSKPATPVYPGNTLPVTSADAPNSQPEQPQPGIVGTAKPAVAADTVNKFAATSLPDTNQVTAKADSAAVEEEELVQEQQAREDKKKDKPKTWEAGFTFATRYAFRQFTPNAADDIFITKVNTRNRTHPERLGYEFGLNVARALTKNFYLETGIAWLQLKENLTYTYTNGTIDTIVVTATTNQTRINPVYKMEERQLASSYAYGGWRLGTTYYFWDNGRRRFSFSMAGGINLLVKGETEEYQNGQYLRKVVFPSRANILEQANYNLLVGAGYNTRLGQKLDLMLMPSLNYFMGSTFKEREPLGLRPYSLGLNIALKRRFSRQN